MTNLRNKIHNEKKVFCSLHNQKKRRRIRTAAEITGETDDVFTRDRHCGESASVLVCPRASSLQTHIPRLRSMTDAAQGSCLGFSEWITGRLDCQTDQDF